MGKGWGIGALTMAALALVTTTAGAQDVLVEYDGGKESFYGHDGGVDWNDDGVPDFLVTGDDRVSVVVVSGADGDAIRSYATPGGTVLASRFAPDLTADGEPDLIVGLTRGGRSTSPPPVVAALDGVSGDTLWESAGNAPVEFFGSDLDVLGDVNSDGVPDVLAAGYNVARLLSGADGTRIREFTSNGACCPSEGVAAAGDIDRDGVPDFLVASQRFSGEFLGPRYPEQGGLVRVVSGRTGELIRVHDADRDLALVGLAVVVAGDIDGDDTPDYAVGANIVKGKSFNPGFTIYTGRGGREVGIVQRKLIPGAKGLQLLPLAPGDVDRDGLPDYLIRVTTEDGGDYVAVLAGRPSEDPILFRLDQPEEQFFVGFGFAGDVSVPPDGIQDLIVSLSPSNVTRVFEVKARPFVPSKVKNATAFVRDAESDEPISARLALAVKKGVQTLSIQTSGLAPSAKPADHAKAATGPFGVFLEEGVGAATFAQIGTLDASGAYTVTGTGTVPPELGVASLADVVGRRVQIRDGGGATLLETVVTALIKAKKAKAKVALAPASAAFPKAKLKLKASFNPKTGALDLKAKVKNAGDGPFVFELETAAGSGVFEEIARVEGSKLKLSTGTGAPLAGAFSVADLLGRAVRVYSADTLVLEGSL